MKNTLFWKSFHLNWNSTLKDKDLCKEFLTEIAQFCLCVIVVMFKNVDQTHFHLVLQKFTKILVVLTNLKVY